MASCQAITRAGEPCSKGALAGTDRCLAHSPPHVKTARGFGGPQNGAGRPRKPRLGEILAARFAERVDEIEAAIFAGINSDHTPTRVRAVNVALQASQREHELAQREREHQDDFDQLPREQLLGIAKRGLARLHATGRLELVFGEDAKLFPALPAVEGSASEVEQPAQEAPSDAPTALLGAVADAPEHEG